MTRMWTTWRSGLLAISLAALTAGCYESDYPLDAEPLIDLNPAVLGVWRCLPLDGALAEPAGTLTITRSSRARVYDAAWQDEGGTADRYEAYASVVQGTTLMNVRQRDERGATGKWAFLRHTMLRPNVLHLQVVTSQAMTGVASTATAVRAAVERGRNTAAWYSDVAVCARATPAR